MLAKTVCIKLSAGEVGILDHLNFHLDLLTRNCKNTIGPIIAYQKDSLACYTIIILINGQHALKLRHGILVALR